MHKKRFIIYCFVHNTDTQYVIELHLRSHYGLVTNWSTFARGVQLEGCAHDLHTPLTNVRYSRAVGTSCVIFKLGDTAGEKGKLGLCIGGSVERIAAVVATGLIAGPIDIVV